ncbi:hypothetical protein KCU71_g1504, partial [Aureobasidium melanogenum]
MSHEPWAVAEAQPEPSSVEQNMVPALTDAAEAVAASKPTNGVTEGAPADAVSSIIGEVRKSTLADLANGDHDAVVAHLAKGLGPHKFLARFSTTSQKSDTEPNPAALTTNGHVRGAEVSEPDGAASIVDDSTSSASTNGLRQDAPPAAEPVQENVSHQSAAKPPMTFEEFWAFMADKYPNELYESD